MLKAPTNSMYGTVVSGMLKLNPKRKDMPSKVKPPRKHFSPVTVMMSLFRLRNLLRLLSMPQKKLAPIMRRLPITFWVNVSFWKAPFVVKKTTLTSNISIPMYSRFAQRSFKKMKAIITVKRDSPLRSRDALMAVVWLRPFKRSSGAVIEPQIITKARTLRSFLFILVSVSEVPSLVRIFLCRGER